MIKEHLTYLQVATLNFFLLNSFILNIGYNYITNISNNDSIIDIAIGGIFIILFTLLIYYIINKNKSKNLIDIIKSYKILKFLIYPILIIILFITITYTLSTLSSFIHYYILKEVSSITITITLLISILYLVKKGISTITKVSEICFYIYLFLMIISCIGLINNIDFSNLKPLFTSNINSNIKASSTYFISSITPLFLLLMIKKDSIKSKEKEEKIPIILTLLSIFLTITQLVIIISVLGINLTNIYQNPDMIVYKKISFLNLLDRVEVMLSLNNFLNGFFILVMCFYTLKETTINIIKTKKEHTILALLGLTFFLLSTTINIKNTIYLNTNIICLVILSIILLRQTIYKYIHH